ncbi:MAG: hypothetical protein MUF87_03190 [Anaerolineae bacterium]|jgi:hypothetical protein|nr:hypothetical protein [Anaerolineae bacterium]
MLNTHTVIVQQHNYRLSWFDSDRSVLLCEIVGSWTWGEAHQEIKIITQMIKGVEHPVYTIFFIGEKAPFLPHGTGAINSIKQLMQHSYPNEQLVIFVKQSMIVRHFVDIVAKAYRLDTERQKYRFVQTMGEAIWLIEQHRKGLL